MHYIFGTPQQSGGFLCAASIYMCVGLSNPLRSQ